MESRLPKPSALKKPTATSNLRAIVPNDRIASNAAATTTMNSRRPLSADVQNLPTVFERPQNHQSNNNNKTKLRRSKSASNLFSLDNPSASSSLNHLAEKRKQRAMSPDVLSGGNRIAAPTRAKLRRSRSVADLGTIYNVAQPAVGTTQKRAGEPLQNLRAKINKPSFNIPAFKSVRAAKPTGATIRRAITSGQSASAASSTGTMKPSTGAIKKVQASTTAPATTIKASGASSTAASKRIPAYDFKARFLDLQERHKVLKEKFDAANEQIEHVQQLQEQFDATQTELQNAQQQLQTEQTAHECCQRQLQSEIFKANIIKENLGQKIIQVTSLTQKCDQLTNENETMRPELMELRTKCARFEEENVQLAGNLSEARELLFRSNMERKELHNAVMDLRGNIRVFCRVRPPLQCEETKPLCGWQYLDESSVEICSNEQAQSGSGGGGPRKLTKHDFSFDQVFHPNSRQEDIFELVSPLIQSALDGYNVCIFAYGQTGSGKTFTMDGIAGEIGIIPRTVDLLFDCVRNYKQLGWEYEIRATFLEIYNEQLYDLLSNESKEMEIRMVSARSPTDIYVSNITEILVNTNEHLRELMTLAKSNRATASTVGNERSSRSHAVTRIQLIGKHAIKQETCVGAINLVDLAGSESPKTSVRMEETKKINKSLSELTNVIMALVARSEHIPFRNSKLTHLLMPCLGGNSKTLMFINVAPFQDCFGESVKSLRFAASVNSCKMAKAKKNKYLSTSAVSFGGPTYPSSNASINSSNSNNSIN